MVVLGILGVISNLLPLNIFGLIVSGVILLVAVLLYVGISKQNQQFVRVREASPTTISKK